nr:outer membrane protein transport protein [Sulfurifustis variabilis]
MRPGARHCRRRCRAQCVRHERLFLTWLQHQGEGSGRSGRSAATGLAGSRDQSGRDGAGRQSHRCGALAVQPETLLHRRGSSLRHTAAGGLWTLSRDRRQRQRAFLHRFEATGLAAFGAFGFSGDPNNLTDNGYDSSTGFGLKLGIMGEVAPGVTLGASYQTEMAMSEFDSYKGLFAEEGGFDIPATATVGLAWNVTPSSTLVFDIQKIWYSKVPSIANPLLPNIGMAPLGADNGAGFGWEDMTIYKLGYQWSTSQAWTWRVGYSMGDQPIPESEVLFNILAPGVVEQHFTFGFTNHLNKNSEWSFAAMYAPEEEVSGPNPLEVPGQQTITLRMDQWELAASYAWKF